MFNYCSTTVVLTVRNDGSKPLRVVLSINDGTAGSAALAVLRLIAQQEGLEFATLPVPVQGEKEGAGRARTNMKKVSRERRIDYRVVNLTLDQQSQMLDHSGCLNLGGNWC